MAAINTHTFLWGGATKCLTLQNEEYVRPLPWGTNWSRIRVAVLCSMDLPVYNLNINNCMLFVGLCKGYAGALSYVTEAACGAMFPSLYGALDYRVGPPKYWNSASVNTGYKLGQAWTQGNVGNYTTFVMVDGTTNNRRMIMSFDLEKIGVGSPRLKVMEASASSYLDFAQESLIETAENYQGAGALAALSNTQITTTTGAFSQGAVYAPYDSATLAVPYATVTSVLDSVNIAWTKNAPALHVFGITVTRQA